MEKLDINIKKIIEKIKKQTGQSPDIIIKEMTLNNIDVAIIFSESQSDRTTINDYILEFFENIRLSKIEIPNLYNYTKENITTHKVNIVKDYKDLFYNLLSGFTLIIINGCEQIISIETRSKLDSGVSEASAEVVIKGPKDAFTENYQTNIGLIRKRIKSESLWLKETVIGKRGKSKVGLFYMKDIVDTKLVDEIFTKIKNIDVDAIPDSNYLVDLISDNKNKMFPIYVSTERPDKVSMHLLEGRIAIILENTQYAIIIPAFFMDFFHSPEDYYQKVINTNFTRIIRLMAFLITLLVPGIYIALTAYNFEAIPQELLISFSSQREGVPFPAILEALLMILTFEILRETDIRIPSKIGSSLSIVGALVLGDAAVSAGIVSPIMVIVVAITSISGLIISSYELGNGIRWWRIIFLVFGSLAGLVGIFISGLLFTISITSLHSFGKPYLFPIAPIYKGEQGDSIFLSNFRKYKKRNILTAKGDKTRQGVSR